MKINLYRLHHEESFLTGKPIALSLHQSAYILRADGMNSLPYLWIAEDPEGPTEIRQFVIYPTGADITGRLDYLGTFIAVPAKREEMPRTFHIFEYDGEVPVDANALVPTNTTEAGDGDAAAAAADADEGRECDEESAAKDSPAGGQEAKE